MHDKSSDYFMLNIFLSPHFQLVKNEIWRSHSLRGDTLTCCLTSIVLDTKELLHHKSYKDNRFVYRFVCQDMPSHSLNASDGESLSSVSSSANFLDCTLRSGDYVVYIILKSCDFCKF